MSGRSSRNFLVKNQYIKLRMGAFEQPFQKFRRRIMNMKRITVFLLVVSILVGFCFSDTFKNKETGEIFHGFMTQKSKGRQTLIYNSDEKKTSSIVPEEYDIAYDSLGRKDTVVTVPITASEVLLSQVVAETIAKSIIEASNKGPQAIVVKIDSPGGRGDYMKIIASAITQTKNCPVMAYISGGPYGGAFASSALIAMACDKVFISPTASIGAIGPIVGTTISEEDFSKYLATYCPESLGSYSIYAIALAHEHNRPAMLVRALIDKRLSVAEVTNIDGTRDFISKDDRQPTQTIVRTLAEGIDSSQSDQKITQAQITSMVLNLPPVTAVEVGLSDKQVNSLTDIPAEINAPQAKLINASGIENIIKKYKAARRNIAESLSRIQWLEERATILEEQWTDIERQLRTGTVTREVTRRSNENYRRDDSRLPRYYDRYYYEPITIFGGDGVVVQRNQSSRSRRSRGQTMETITTEEPASNIEDVEADLLVTLANLMLEYQRAIAQGKRWPGGLPPEIPLQTLEKNRISAIALSNYIYDQQRYGP